MAVVPSHGPAVAGRVLMCVTSCAFQESIRFHLFGTLVGSEGCVYCVAHDQ